jgi:hypothetical protein
MISMVTTKIKYRRSRKICLTHINLKKICLNNQIRAIKITLSILEMKMSSRRKIQISLRVKSKNKLKNRIKFRKILHK